jgi:hypothetical protein
MRPRPELVERRAEHTKLWFDPQNKAWFDGLTTGVACVAAPHRMPEAWLHHHDPLPVRTRRGNREPQVRGAGISSALHNVCTRMMTRDARCVSMRVPRRWADGDPRAAAQHRSRGRQSGYLAWHGGQIIQASERGPDAAKSSNGQSAAAGCQTWQASQRPGHDRAGRSLRSLAGIRDHPGHSGAAPNALLLLPNPRGRWPARLKVFAGRLRRAPRYPRGGNVGLDLKG